MHTVFQVAELRSLIFEYVSLLPESTQALLRLALTCTLFTDAALTYLWRSQSSTTPLLRIGPEDLLSLRKDGFANDGTKISLPDFSSFFKPRVEETLTLPRPIEPGELERMKYYASKIVNLQNSPPSVRGLFHENLLTAIISHVPGWNFLPNLHRLTLYLEVPTQYISRNNRLPFLRHLLSPNIRQLAIISLGLHPTDEWAALFEDISSRCRNITHLDIHVRFERVESPSLSKMICGMQHLETIDCRPSVLSSEAIQHLRRLPSLKTWNEIFIEFHDDIDTLFNPPENAHHTFPSLRAVSLVVSNWNLAADFIEKLNQPLTTLDLLEKSEHPSWSPEHIPQFSALTQAISRSIMRDTLRTIHLITWSTEIPSEDTICKDFDPLFACKQLSSLSLRFDNIHALDDQWVEKASKSWPELSVLKIHQNNTHSHKAATRITLQGLIPLVQRCTKLEEVCLPAQWIAFDLNEIPEGVCNRNITKLDFSSLSLPSPPPADRAERISRCLITLFPCLSDINAEDHVRYRVDEIKRLVREAYEYRLLS